MTTLRYSLSSPAVVMTVKSLEEEPYNYLRIIARRKKQKIRDPCYDMCVIPVNFSTVEKKNMLANLKDLTDSSAVVLNLERHSGLVLALRTAQATDLILDKQAMQPDDMLDAFGFSMP
jgi:hypothetical protein